MATDATYSPGVYRTQGGNKLVVGGQGRISIAGGAPLPTTGTLTAHTTSATLTGNDFGGTISVVTDATGTAANVGACTVTFGTVRTTAPIVILVNLTGGTASTTLYAGGWRTGAVTTTTWTLVNDTALTASSTYLVGYIVIDVE